MLAPAPCNHLAGVDDDPFADASAAARSAGMPVFDRALASDFSRPRSRPADYRALLGDPGSGLTYCAFHPNAPGGAEIERIEPDQFYVRTDEYEQLSTAGWKDWLESRPTS
ncbi:MAG: hypothetical protein F4110_02130 [Acidimicrobiaceae bacterium]|nr:hypothetical protein [Acidimicrobiaceae bacterium]MXZ99698.1 hypothetical protein [Acidimicrobiaceae bacterium]MYE97093.1 hypothetical protein [Acidimicrobiaceae bacterium]MYH43665.1 hypothetical protein [Acidimicrobiaceae bacterium]MYI52784.1 hypothetical protein [Acidimicrobiaceae bacterium]